MSSTFDHGEVVHMGVMEHLRRIAYFAAVSFLILPGAGFAVYFMLLSPTDALLVLPVAFAATALGANTACHMYFTHRSFACGRAVHILLAFLGTILCQDSIAQWTANHKRHHRHVDIVDKDPHTPRQFGEAFTARCTLGLLWASAGWKFSRVRTSKAFYARQVLDDPVSAWFDRYYVMLSLAGLVAPFMLGYVFGGAQTAFKWFCYFGAFRVFVGYFFTEFVVNGLCHLVGSVKFRARGSSRNLVFLSPLTLGATLHHNHHAFPRVLSPAVDGEIDPMAWLYRFLEWSRLIRMEPGPTAIEVASKKLQPQPAPAVAIQK
jgi:stearoyl-CoA desaturase (delta-9 desaturase)